MNYVAIGISMISLCFGIFAYLVISDKEGLDN